MTGIARSATGSGSRRSGCHRPTVRTRRLPSSGTDARPARTDDFNFILARPPPFSFRVASSPALVFTFIKPPASSLPSPPFYLSSQCGVRPSALVLSPELPCECDRPWQWGPLGIACPSSSVASHASLPPRPALLLQPPLQTDLSFAPPSSLQARWSQGARGVSAHPFLFSPSSLLPFDLPQPSPAHITFFSPQPILDASLTHLLLILTPL